MEYRDQLNPYWTVDVEQLGYERFCTDVSNLRLSIDREQTKNTIINIFSNHMSINFNVFATLMKHRIHS